MAGELARRLDRAARHAACASTAIGPRPKQAQRPAGRRDDGRFDAALASGRRRGSAGSCRRGSCSTCSARVGLIEPLALADGAASGRPTARSSACIAGWAGTRRPIVGRPGGDERGDRRAGPQRHDQGQRPRPMLLGKRARLVGKLADRFGRGEIAHMDDQRVEARAGPWLRRFGDRGGVGGVGGEAVDRLGRHRDRLAGEDQRARPRRSLASLKGSDRGAIARGASRIRRSQEVQARSRLDQARPGRSRAASCARGSSGHSSLEEAAALGLAQPGAGAGGDEHADAALDHDQPFVLESLIGLGDGQRIGLLLGGEGADRRQRVAVAYIGRRGSRRRSFRAGGRKPAFRGAVSASCCPNTAVRDKVQAEKSTFAAAARAATRFAAAGAAAPRARVPAWPMKMKPAIRSPGPQKAARTRSRIGLPAGHPAGDDSRARGRRRAGSSPPRRTTIPAPTPGSCARRPARRRARPARPRNARIARPCRDLRGRRVGLLFAERLGQKQRASASRWSSRDGHEAPRGQLAMIGRARGDGQDSLQLGRRRAGPDHLARLARSGGFRAAKAGWNGR